MEVGVTPKSHVCERIAVHVGSRHSLDRAWVFAGKILPRPGDGTRYDRVRTPCPLCNDPVVMAPVTVCVDPTCDGHGDTHMNRDFFVGQCQLPTCQTVSWASRA